MTWKLRVEEAPPPPPPPPEKKATLNIKSNPSGAKVYVDGRYIGTTPVTVDVAAGTHTVRAELEGYAPQEKTVSCSAGQTCTVEFNFAAGANWAPVAIALLGVGTALVGMVYMDKRL